MGMSDQWYKNAVVYGLDVATFMDADGDGHGDFQGLIERLDHLSSLGITCIWLLPFYPTPDRDNGYDISDHYGVEPRLGTPGEFVEFLREADERGMRVILDLVANHTSDEHPWFVSARRDPESRFRDYYIWRDEPPEDTERPIVFRDPDATVWSYDDEADAYYYHKFYAFEPDLNVENPAVRREIHEIMGFWLQLGVSGFRVDAAPHLIGDGTEAAEPRHWILRDLRRFVTARRGDAALLAESDVDADEIADYFGDGDGMHLLFNFLLDNYLFLALARGESEPLNFVLRLLPPRPESGQWANFLRNLDELDLERLSEAEREEVYAAFAPDPDMRIYGRGIRRRLAPMLGGDRDRLEVAYSLLFSLPGSPVLVYGDEIGMGEDLSLEGRDSVRTPMQWSSAENAGFSDASPEDLVHPVVSEGAFAYENVNVADQRRDPRSFLSWMQRIIRTRRESPELGWGEFRLLETGDPHVFAHRCDWEGRAAIAIHNLGEEPQTVELEAGEPAPDGLEPVLGAGRIEHTAEGRLRVELDRYGYTWLRRRGRPGAPVAL